MVEGHIKECYSTDAEHQCVCAAKYFIQQRNDLAWAIAWFLNGGSRDKLEQRLMDYEATL